MTRLPIRGEVIFVEGSYSFQGLMTGYPEIAEELRLRFEITPGRRFFHPIVKELSNVIPKNGDHHVNADGSFCLGSELDIYWAMSGPQKMEGFLEHCLDPYLYKMIAKIRGYADGIIGGELAHGNAGLIESYGNHFGLRTEAQIKEAALLVLLKKRIANKRSCPCGCGKNLGQCKLHLRINAIRKSMFTKAAKHCCLEPFLPKKYFN